MESGFIDEAWIMRNGDVTYETSLEYFSRCPMYDKSCNNELLRNCNNDPNELFSMKGIEYCVESTSCISLFIIAKQYRTSPMFVQKLDFYVIMDNMIYQAPTVSQLVISRLSKCCNHLQNIFDVMQKVVSDEVCVQSDTNDQSERQNTTSFEFPTQEETKINSITKGLLYEYLPEKTTELFITKSRSNTTTPKSGPSPVMMASGITPSGPSSNVS